MITVFPSPLTVRVEPGDAESGFRCGKPTLDDYFAKHAVANSNRNIGITYVLRKSEDDPAELPRVLGYYTISMSLIESQAASNVMTAKLPRYPMPAGLIGKLASDERTRGRGLRVGETLLMDAISRILAAADVMGCLGIVLDALDEDAERFYLKYQFVTVEDLRWPRKMFLPVAQARAALAA
jgi:hypothetical protein